MITHPSAGETEMEATASQITALNRNHGPHLDRLQDHPPPQPPVTAADHGALVVVHGGVTLRGQRGGDRELLPLPLLALTPVFPLLLSRAHEGDDKHSFGRFSWVPVFGCSVI